MPYAVIVENDRSEWEDETGVKYHFPKRYLKYLPPGTDVIYYKGKIRDTSFRPFRLTDDPHYFGVARIGKVFPDRQSSKGDHFALIEDYRPFVEPVPIKIDGEYLETIPESRRTNYWRDGVREIEPSTYEHILSLAEVATDSVRETKARERRQRDPLNDVDQGLTSGTEGKRTRRYSTTYERDPRLRRQAVAIHGVTCKGCGFNFESYYGPHGADYIHVHHLQPLAEVEGEVDVNPETDMTVLCPNCHAMVHRYKDRTLSMAELRALIEEHGRVDAMD